MIRARFYVLPAQRHWIVVDRTGEILFAVRFTSQRKALRFAHRLEQDGGQFTVIGVRNDPALLEEAAGHYPRAVILRREEARSR